MNEVYFKDGVLTSTEAQNVCNIAQEKVKEYTAKLDNMSFINTYIKSVMNPSQSIQASFGSTKTSWIPETIEKIGQLNALCAWLKEAIKVKVRLESDLSHYNVNRWALENDLSLPKLDSAPEGDEVTEEDIMNTWSREKLNRYYSLNSIAATIGKYIHQDGKLALVRAELNEKKSKPALTKGDGRDTLVFEYESSVDNNEPSLDNIYMSLQALHRKYNSELNYLKSDLKSSCNKRNNELEIEYQNALSKFKEQQTNYQTELRTLNSKYQQWLISEHERISKLKIAIPDDLKNIYNDVKNLINY